MIRVNVNVKQLSHVIYRLGHFSDHWMSLVCHSYFNPTSNPHLFHRPSDSCLKQKYHSFKRVSSCIPACCMLVNIFYFIYSNCILHPYGSSNYNTKACKHIKEKQHKHNKYVNVGEIFDRRGSIKLPKQVSHI